MLECRTLPTAVGGVFLLLHKFWPHDLTLDELFDIALVVDAEYMHGMVSKTDLMAFAQNTHVRDRHAVRSRSLREGNVLVAPKPHALYCIV